MRQANTRNSIQLMFASSTHVLNCKVCWARDEQINKYEWKRERKPHKPRNLILVVLCHAQCTLRLSKIIHYFCLNVCLRCCFTVYMWTQRNASDDVNIGNKHSYNFNRKKDISLLGVCVCVNVRLYNTSIKFRGNGDVTISITVTVKWLKYTYMLDHCHEITFHM